jgi:hypothetical protein
MSVDNAAKIIQEKKIKTKKLQQYTNFNMLSQIHKEFFLWFL